MLLQYSVVTTTISIGMSELIISKYIYRKYLCPCDDLLYEINLYQIPIFAFP